MGDNNLVHFVFPLENYGHLIYLVDVTKDALFEVRFGIYPDVS